MVEFFIALALVSLSLVLQGNIGLNLADEGYLWNGTLRVAKGEVPIRDFRAYDPGRYYFCLVGAKLFGLGIRGVRRTTALFQLIGLWAGLLAAARVVDNLVLSAAVGLLLTWWMYPRHKYFEHSLTLIAVYVAVLLVESSSPEIYFVAGVFVGAAGVMGLNHGLYCFVSLSSIAALLALKQPMANGASHYAVFLGGVLCGYAPMLAMWAFVGGFLSKYWDEKVVTIVRRGTINLRLPIPWPWKSDLQVGAADARLSALLLGILFVAIPISYAAGAAWVLLTETPNTQPLLVASTIVGVTYFYHALSRADLPHLCQAVQPFLLLVLAATSTLESQAATLVMITGLSLMGFYLLRPYLPLAAKWKNPEGYVKYDLRGDTLWLERPYARLLDRVRQLEEQNVDPESSIFIAPAWCALYPVLGRHTPVYSDFMVYPETAKAQERLITELETKHVTWALIEDFALDGRDDLRFSDTHPLVWRYLVDGFDWKRLEGIDFVAWFLRRKA